MCLRLKDLKKLLSWHDIKIFFSKLGLAFSGLSIIPISNKNIIFPKWSADIWEHEGIAKRSLVQKHEQSEKLETKLQVSQTYLEEKK